MANVKFTTIELTKDIPGYKTGSKFLLQNGPDQIVWKTDDKLNPIGKLHLPYDKNFFKEVKSVSVSAGYYAVTSANKGNMSHPNHLLRLNENLTVASKLVTFPIQNLSIGRMVDVRTIDIRPVTPYTFINSNGIISHDYIERDENLYNLRMALGIAGIESDMRTKLLEIKNQIL